MTRARKAIGRLMFVGAGPGDAGLLTERAREALTTAQLVYATSAVGPEVLGLVPAAAEVHQAADAGTELGKVMLNAARAGSVVVRLVAGDPYDSADVTAEVKATTRTSVPFEVIPGVPVSTGVPAYAGLATGPVRTVVDVDEDTDWAKVAAAPGALVLTADASALGKIAVVLQEHGMSGTVPATVTVRAPGEDQRSIDSTLGALDTEVTDATGPIVVTLGSAVSQRAKLAWWERRSLYGWRVLVPRTKDQAGAMSARLRVHGATPSEVPTIAVEPPRTPAQMERAIKGLVTGRYEWIVFTSVNAVRAVREKFEEFGLDARAFAGVKIACVGSTTADAVRAFGINPEMVPTGEQSSDGLLADFPPYDDVFDPINRILLPRADIATETLSAGLVERGWEVEDVTAYRTVRAAPPPAPIRDAIKSGGFDAVLFTSSSTVRNLVGIAGKPHTKTIVACIGPKTAETAKEVGLRVDVQPEVAEVGALVEALAVFARELRDSGEPMPPARRGRTRSKSTKS